MRMYAVYKTHIRVYVRVYGVYKAYIYVQINNFFFNPTAALVVLAC
jgi:hypothetical protein